MTTIEEKLETLFAKVRTLPKDRQEMAVMLLEDIASADAEYVLSEEELAVLEPRLEDARRGENLVDAKDVDILNKPWA